MNKVEFIKRLCEKADGFELSGLGVCNFPGCAMPLHPMEIAGSDLIYPLLLQRAIEGVNREKFKRGSYEYPYEIEQNIDKYTVILFCKGEIKSYRDFYFSPKMNHDTAKEAALKWVCEQEKEK